MTCSNVARIIPRAMGLHLVGNVVYYREEYRGTPKLLVCADGTVSAEAGGLPVYIMREAIELWEEKAIPPAPEMCIYDQENNVLTYSRKVYEIGYRLVQDLDELLEFVDKVLSVRGDENG